jgi:hypothetical protein
LEGLNVGRFEGCRLGTKLGRLKVRRRPWVRFSALKKLKLGNRLGS